MNEAKAEGLEVEVVEFTDRIAPNEAPRNGDIDVDDCQHIPFLENASREKGYKFESPRVGASSKLGLHSVRSRG